MVAGVGWFWSSLLSRKLFFLDKRRSAWKEVALNLIGTRALTFIPRFPPDFNHRILFDFGHPVSLPIYDMASTLAIGLGVGVAAFLVCAAVTPRAGPGRLS